MWWRRAIIVQSQVPKRSFSKPSWLLSLSPYSDSSSKRGKAAPLQERKMRDKVTIWVKGGEGGNGCWSYRRTRTDRYGKPDGGNGGRGGDVILECSSGVWDFSNLQHHLNAKRGGPGASKNRIGSRGSDKAAQVPVGTVIHLVSGEIPTSVVDTSVKSLQPWDIPDTDQAEPSRSPQDNDNSINILSDEEAPDDSFSSPPKVSAQKSVQLHRKVTDVRETVRAKKKVSFRGPRPRYRGRSGSIQAVEYDLNEYEPGFEEDKKVKATFRGSRPRYQWRSGRIHAVEYDLNEYASDFEEDNEEEGENNEECEGEYEEENVEGDEDEVQYSVAELTKPGQRLVVARGGEGGLGNVCLRKEPKHVKSHKIDKHDDASDDMGCEDSEDNSSLTTGRPGSESVFILELKSIADVGLVGMPNAGKSTLLGAISRAKPTVGHYAFTTLRPNIGNLNYDNFFVTVADIPGLIKGAHENRGLGHAFLRHIERTKVLAYVVDMAAALDGSKGIPPWEQLRDLVSELEHHQEGLSHRPSLIVANKIDEEGAEDVYEELKRRVQGVPIFPVCAVLEEGVSELKDALRRLMDGTESQFLDLDSITCD